jgi:hypothetical protein
VDMNGRVLSFGVAKEGAEDAIFAILRNRGTREAVEWGPSSMIINPGPSCLVSLSSMPDRIREALAQSVTDEPLAYVENSERTYFGTK